MTLLNLTTVAALCSLLGFVNADAIYAKNSPVLQVTAKTYNSVIAQSNHTSILEFYAPWCGHCQNLKPAYEKAAKSLAGLAKVAAINCDEEANKPLCGQMGVQGFPTLKIVKPSSKRGKPVVEDYQGARSAKAIVDAVADKIPNHVKKVQDDGLDAWLDNTSTTAKAILFTDKGTTSSLIRALAIDFLGSIDVAQVRNKETAAVARYNIKKFPTIILLPGGNTEPLMYDGEMTKAAIVNFFSQVASPNPDPAPVKAKTSSSKKSKDDKSATASSAFSKASEAHKASDYEDYLQDAGTIELNENTPTESPLPIVDHEQKPMIVEDFIPDLPHLSSATELASGCLSPKSGSCILIFLPSAEDSERAAQALSSFAEVAEKHKKRHSKIFPFYSVSADNSAAPELRRLLGLNSQDDLEVIAINMKRKWWKSYSATSFDIVDVNGFVDAIRLGEGSKQKLPGDISAIAEKAADTIAVPEPAGIPVPQPSAEEVVSDPAAPEPSIEADHHDEL